MPRFKQIAKYFNQLYSINLDHVKIVCKKLDLNKTAQCLAVFKALYVGDFSTNFFKNEHIYFIFLITLYN